MYVCVFVCDTFNIIFIIKKNTWLYQRGYIEYSSNYVRYI